MIDLYYVEKNVSNTQTDFLAIPCQAKKLYVFGAANVEFRDGGPTGRLVARMRGTTNNPCPPPLNCTDNEVFTFAIKPYVVVQGTDAIIGMYFMNNPVGKQGS